MILGFAYNDTASFLERVFPGMVLDHVTIAGAGATVGFKTKTGCGPISVGRIEKIIVPVIEAVVVKVIVETTVPAGGDTAEVGTSTQI